MRFIVSSRSSSVMFRESPINRCTSSTVLNFSRFFGEIFVEKIILFVRIVVVAPWHIDFISFSNWYILFWII